MDSGELPEEPVTAAMEQKQELHTIDNVTALVPKQIEKVISLDEENADQFQQLMIMEKAGSEDIWEENDMPKSEVKEIIRWLKKKKIRIFDIPEEYENDTQIVNFERKAGLPMTGKQGFDIISNSFFVEEKLIYADSDGEEQKRNVFLSFDSFDSYFDFLNGDVYKNACYKFCPLFDNTIISQKIDLKKLMTIKSFTEDTIDDYSLS